MKSLLQRINESLSANESVMINEADEKDWMRMADLYLNDKDGAGVARAIKNKGKAIARYVTGLKVADSEFPEVPKRSDNLLSYGTFHDFYNTAVSLGATYDEIKAEYEKLSGIPEKISEKISIFAAKSFGSWVTGDFSKAVHKAGFDMSLSKGGNAKTWQGKDAMSRNGCKWTIGYVATIKTATGDVVVEFDAITDEGVNNNTIRYVMSSSFGKLDTHTIYNKTNFIAGVLTGLSELSA